MRVLFIGNSHTYYNDMPEIVRSLGAERGIQIEVTMLAKPGEGLDYHAKEPQTRFNILYGNYDYVVLQHKAHPMGDINLMYEGAEKIMGWIEQAGAKAVFYETWAKKGDEKSQSEMSGIYEKLCRKHKAILAPVGDIWQSTRKKAPQRELYNSDGEHANAEGSRLVAKVILDALTEN